ncbi:hypothetical protein YC2023_115030 [Brassica napus]
MAPYVTIIACSDSHDIDENSIVQQTPHLISLHSEGYQKGKNPLKVNIEKTCQPKLPFIYFAEAGQHIAESQRAQKTCLTLRLKD